ncbi:glycosyltransferase [Aldersonia sp. NBC_00410]|uniref:glycosyltransferase family 2 protein n=1 Tax=Aldersonia sp. NBC_00410 TaxID=2975954 RepID=UPI002258DF8D|nr:glycosyltransferase family 2 protein [Aldersonia sp. NBC_00410]MCX5041705.1 glycosyltransferase [Aldersonia sp. NBC_00410]
MSVSAPLVSIGLPVRNGADRVEPVIKSILAQTYENLELIICDNASTDGTEDLCRTLAAQDERVVYHRHPVNIGLNPNFDAALRLATGTYFRYVGDDDWLDPACIGMGVDTFAADERLVLVTNQVGYTGVDGRTETAEYSGADLGSDDPVRRFAEMLRLLNESYLLMDPEYGLFRRETMLAIPRRNMLRDDEVFAAKMALTGPWAHVPEVLMRRNWKFESQSVLAQRFAVPRWQGRISTALAAREMIRWVDQSGLDDRQRRSARRAVVRHYYLRRHQRAVVRRSRKLVDMLRSELPPGRAKTGRDNPECGRADR